jgi:hypothetical protein
MLITNVKGHIHISVIKVTLWSRVLLEKLLVAQIVKKFQQFMEGSLPCSQDPGDGLYSSKMNSVYDATLCL